MTFPPFLPHPAMAKLYQHGSIASGARADLVRADVLVGDDGAILAVGPGLGDADLPPEADPAALERIDCTGCVLVPGMFDLHVHAREPGAEHKETLRSCAAAALNGGVTGMVLMPDTSPPVDTGNLVKSIQDLAAEASPAAMLVAGCLTKQREGAEMAAYSGMAARRVPLLTDADRAVPCPDLLRRCLEYARDFDLLVATHGDTPALSKAGVVNEGLVSYRLGLPGIPAISQEIGIERDLRLARHTGARLHIQQLSTAAGLEAVSRARQEGVSVSCEVSPHHLLLDETAIADYDTRYKLRPPLCLPRDREALVAGLLDGAIDAIACDHAPHTEFEKSADFASAPFGVAGLDTAVVALHDGFIAEGVFGWDLLVRKYSEAPRRIAGLPPTRIEPGARAEFFVFDPAAETRVEAASMRTKSPVTPFLGRTLRGAVRETVLG